MDYFSNDYEHCHTKKSKVVQWKQACSLEFEGKLMEAEKTTWSELTKNG